MKGRWKWCCENGKEKSRDYIWNRTYKMDANSDVSAESHLCRIGAQSFWCSVSNLSCGVEGFQFTTSIADQQPRLRFLDGAKKSSFFRNSNARPFQTALLPHRKIPTSRKRILSTAACWSSLRSCAGSNASISELAEEANFRASLQK